jgi:hypothetical protein
MRAQVVGEDEDDVRLIGGECCERGEEEGEEDAHVHRDERPYSPLSDLTDYLYDRI